MRMNHPIAGAFILAFSALVITSSCNSSEDKKSAEAAAPAPPIKESLTAGALDTLYIERKAFDDLQGQGQPKLIFSFVFKNPDSLVLHGWLFKTPFDPTPIMELKYFNRSKNASYVNGTYFGNVVLQPQDIAKIRQALTPAMNFVLFAPKIDGNNIKYEILVTDKLRVTKDAMLVVSGTGADANPSPPKTY